MAKVIYGGIIFDLDGTLLDTLRDIAACMNAVLQRNGLKTHPAADYKIFVGEGMNKLVENAVEGQPASEDIKKLLLSQMHYEYSRRWNETTKPYNSIPELFLELAIYAPHIKIAVLSNKPHDFTNEMVKHYFPNVKFDMVAGAKNNIPKKPDATAALHICHAWKMPPQQVLFVGDSKIDMQTAVNAHCVPVGVLWGFRSKEELLQNGAKYMLSSPAELIKILK